MRQNENGKPITGQRPTSETARFGNAKRRERGNAIARESEDETGIERGRGNVIRGIECENGIGSTVGIESKSLAVSNTNNSSSSNIISTGMVLLLITRMVIPCLIQGLPLDIRSTCLMGIPTRTYLHPLNRLGCLPGSTDGILEIIHLHPFRPIIITIKCRT